MINKAGIAEENKEQMVLSFTDQRTFSLREMDYYETQMLFKNLEELLGYPENAADKMKRKILSLAHEMKWHVDGSRRINMARVDNWCIGKFKAALDDLNYFDLMKAVTAFTNVHLTFLKGI